MYSLFAENGEKGHAKYRWHSQVVRSSQAVYARAERYPTQTKRFCEQSDKIASRKHLQNQQEQIWYREKEEGDHRDFSYRHIRPLVSLVASFFLDVVLNNLVAFGRLQQVAVDIHMAYSTTHMADADLQMAV